jgi:hypothetical protein
MLSCLNCLIAEVTGWGFVDRDKAVHYGQVPYGPHQISPRLFKRNTKKQADAKGCVPLGPCIMIHWNFSIRRKDSPNRASPTRRQASLKRLQSARLLYGVRLRFSPSEPQPLSPASALRTLAGTCRRVQKLAWGSNWAGPYQLCGGRLTANRSRSRSARCIRERQPIRQYPAPLYLSWDLERQIATLPGSQLQVEK